MPEPRMPHPLELMMGLLSASPLHREWTVGVLCRNIAPPLRLGTYALFFDENSNCYGLVTWGLFSDEVIDRYLHDPKCLFEPNDWISGHNLWLIDIVTRPGSGYRTVKGMHHGMWNVLPIDTNEFRYCRGKNFKKVMHHVRPLSQINVARWPADISAELH